MLGLGSSSIASRIRARAVRIAQLGEQLFGQLLRRLRPGQVHDADEDFGPLVAQALCEPGDPAVRRAERLRQFAA